MDDAGRQLNASLAQATAACGDITFDRTVIRIELYHLRQAAPHNRVDWHRHPFTELTWVEGGPIIYQHAEHTITLSDGELFFMPAFTPHCWHSSSGATALHGFMLTILPAADRHHSRVGQLPAAAAALGYRLPRLSAAADAFERAEAHAIHADDLGIEAAAGYLRAGLATVFRQIVAAVPADDAHLPLADRSDTPAALEKAVAFITTHLAEPIDVAAVARHVHLSARQLDRLFHHALDMPAGAFVLHTRLERARYLLGHSQMPIKQIARACGFADPNYFSRIFRQRHRQSPSAYRRDR